MTKVAILGGTGRMGVHLGCHWANLGVDVTLCSRTPQKAQAIIDQLKTGNGFVQASAAGGNIKVPPPKNPAAAKDWKLTAGSVADAANADVIVLATMFDNQWAQLAQISEAIRGKGKWIIDLTNPFLRRPDGGSSGIPKADMPPGGPGGVLVHKQKLGDDSVKWACVFKHTLWLLILPDGPKKKSNGVEVFGDAEPVQLVTDLLVKGGWTPKYRGDLSVAPRYEPMGPKAAPPCSPSFFKRFMVDRLACI